MPPTSDLRWSRGGRQRPDDLTVEPSLNVGPAKPPMTRVLEPGQPPGPRQLDHGRGVYPEDLSDGFGVEQRLKRRGILHSPSVCGAPLRLTRHTEFALTRSANAGPVVLLWPRALENWLCMQSFGARPRGYFSCGTQRIQSARPNKFALSRTVQLRRQGVPP